MMVHINTEKNSFSLCFSFYLIKQKQKSFFDRYIHPNNSLLTFWAEQQGHMAILKYSWKGELPHLAHQLSSLEAYDCLIL